MKAAKRVKVIGIPNESRLYFRWFAATELLACLGLACFVDMKIWLAGISLLAIGLLWHWIARNIVSKQN